MIFLFHVLIYRLAGPNLRSITEGVREDEDEDVDEYDDLIEGGAVNVELVEHDQLRTDYAGDNDVAFEDGHAPVGVAMNDDGDADHEPLAPVLRRPSRFTPVLSPTNEQAIEAERVEQERLQSAADDDRDLHTAIIDY